MIRHLRLLVPLSAALMLTGCSFGPGSGSASSVVSSDAIHVSGRTMGGQAPVAYAHYQLFEIGHTGYGSAPVLLGSADGGADGYFNLTASVPCTTVNGFSSVYIVSEGGTAGFGTNAAIVEGAGLGDCTAAANATVSITEITTAAMAIAFSHFFAPSAGGYTDVFGEPASVTALDSADQYTLPLLVNETTGYAVKSGGNITTESAKLQSLGNILGACVNDSPVTATHCASLFSLTTSSRLTPVNTLEAAINLALAPAHNVGPLFNTIPTSSAYGGGLTAAPNDWSVALSYQYPYITGVGQGADIDSKGRLWFPALCAGDGCIAYLDPSNLNINGAYVGSTTYAPAHVTIDTAGVAWADDLMGNTLRSVNTSSQALGSLSVPAGTAINSVAAGPATGGSFVLLNPDTTASIYSFSSSGGTYSYTASAATVGQRGEGLKTLSAGPGGTQGFAATTAQAATRFGVATAGTPGPVNTSQGVAGGIAYDGSEFLVSTGINDDGFLCGTATLSCYSIAPAAQYQPEGMAVDGAGTLWIADLALHAINAVTPNGTSTPYVTSGQVNVTSYIHSAASDPTDGATLTDPRGISIDNAGNIWALDSDRLTEVIGLAAPTIAPLSSQIAGGTSKVGTKP